MASKNNNPEQDYRSELDMWQSMWDEAEKDGVHPLAELPKPVPGPNTDRAQDFYYNYLDSEAEQILQEEKMKTPNPVYPDSAGPDQDTTPPVWVSEDLLKEVEGLKKKMFDIENRMAELGAGKKLLEKPITQGTEKKELMNQLNALKKKIEQVSSVLGTNFENTPWLVERK